MTIRYYTAAEVAHIWRRPVAEVYRRNVRE
jgi:hypothetical protein